MESQKIRQTQSTHGFLPPWLIGTGLAALLVIAAASWVLRGERSPAPPAARIAAVQPQLNPQVENATWSPTIAEPGPAAPEPPATPAPPQTMQAAATRSPSATELEQQFRSESATAQRIELVQEICGWNNAEAVAVLARIFPIARHPKVKEAIISGLADIDAGAAPEVRLALLRQALQGQPREVRLAAVEVLDDVEDPRATVLLQRAMKSDPDAEVREVAAALHNARKEE